MQKEPKCQKDLMQEQLMSNRSIGQPTKSDKRGIYIYIYIEDQSDTEFALCAQCMQCMQQCITNDVYRILELANATLAVI